MKHAITLLAGFATLCATSLPAGAQLAPPEAPPDAPQPPSEDAPTDMPPPTESDAVAFKIDKPRPLENKILLGSMLGASVLFGAVALGFHLDSRDKSDEVSRVGELTGLTWTQEREDTRKAAIRSRNISIGFYAVGGAALMATIVTFIVTEPGEETVSLSGLDSTIPIFAATSDGAVLGAQWSFQ